MMKYEDWTRVSQITPKSSDKAAHLPNWTQWVKINQTFFRFLDPPPPAAKKFSDCVKILFGWIWPYGAQLGEWAALSLDLGVI